MSCCLPCYYLDMPVFLGGTDRIDADIGQNVTLRCFWDSNPKPQIYWFYENSDLVLGRESELHLPNVDQSDSGSYHCYASADKVLIDKFIRKKNTKSLNKEYQERNIIKKD